MVELPIGFITRTTQLTMACAVCVLLLGCRNDPYLDSHIEILNAERRALEDQLYQLEYDYEKKVAEVERLKEKLGDGDEGESRRRRSDDTPRVDFPSDDFDSLDLSPPSVTPGVPDVPSIELPEPNTSSRLHSRTMPTEPVRAGPSLLEPDDPRITHIHVDPLQTGGSDFDQRPGDDGIFLVLQPRNRSDRFVPLAGPITVVALDYSRREAGAEPRFAKWDLTAQQVDNALQNNSTQKGIYLRLPWAEETPTSSKLMVAVRYSTADGRKLDASRDIFVTLPGQFSQRWTPRSSADSNEERQQDNLNVARQPSPNDGAQLRPMPPSGEPTSGSIAPVTHETNFPETRATSTASKQSVPTWTPAR